jgi:hypothetical protein
VRLIALDQSTATLIAAIIAATASSVASILAFFPNYLEWRRVHKRRRRLVAELSGEDDIRSLEWLSLRVGMTEVEIAAMLPDIGAHGVRMSDGAPGAALDSRHRVGSSPR